MEVGFADGHRIEHMTSSLDSHCFDATTGNGKWPEVRYRRIRYVAAFLTSIVVRNTDKVL